MGKGWEYTIKVVIVFSNLARLGIEGFTRKYILPLCGATSKKSLKLSIFSFKWIYSYEILTKHIITFYIERKICANTC